MPGRPMGNAKGLLTFALILVAWQLLAAYVFKSVLLLPTPSDVLKAFFSLASSGELLQDIMVSLRRMATGFAIAALLAVPLGIAMGLSRKVQRLFDSPVELLRPIGAIVWIPFLLIVLGLGDAYAISLVMYGCFFPIVLSSVSAVGSVDRLHVKSAMSLGASRTRLIREVLLPAGVPLIITGLRLGAGVGWAVIIGAELVGATSGLGYLILFYSSLFRLDDVIVGMIVIGIIGLLFDRAFRALQTVVSPWSEGVKVRI